MRPINITATNEEAFIYYIKRFIPDNFDVLLSAPARVGSGEESELELQLVEYRLPLVVSYPVKRTAMVNLFTRGRPSPNRISTWSFESETELRNGFQPFRDSDKVRMYIDLLLKDKPQKIKSSWEFSSRGMERILVIDEPEFGKVNMEIYGKYETPDKSGGKPFQATVDVDLEDLVKLRVGKIKEVLESRNKTLVKGARVS